MCGRFVSPDTAAIEQMWNVGRNAPNPLVVRTPVERHFNVRPTTQIPVIRKERETGEYILTTARWGLIPHWWKQPKMPTFTINARSEEAAGKPMWRGAYRGWRCLVPAEGWYEWPEKDGIDPVTGEITQVGHPHFIFQKSRLPIFFGGLMSLWIPPDKAEPILSCAILTRAASTMIAPVHDRMPVILPAETFQTWLDPAVTDPDQVSALIRDNALDEIEHYGVSKLVNVNKSSGPALIEPLRATP